MPFPKSIKTKSLMLIMAGGLLFQPLQAAVRDTISLSRNWQFYRGDVVHTDELKNKSMEVVHLPHDFQISQPWVAPQQDEKVNKNDAANNTKSRLSSRGFKEMAVGWYRRTVTPDNSWKNRRIVLDVEGIMLVGDVYLNGQRIGGTDYGYLGFETDITDKLIFGQENEILVRADTQSPDNSRWYTGGGLYRDVRLIISNKDTHFARHPLFITTVDNRQVCIQAELFNKRKAEPLTVGVTIVDQSGQTVAQHEQPLHYSPRWRQREYPLDTITLQHPQLWSCESPYLYTAIVTIYNRQHQPLDQVSQSFGVRTIAFSPQYGLRINGKKVLLKGFANHHTLGALGAAAYPRAIEKRLQLMKSFGYNHVRTAHNPYSEEFLNLCDKYGIIVVNELYDKWLQQFAGGRTSWQNLWQNDITEWVQRDRNHPSVVMWSLGNELQQRSDLPFNDWGVTAYRLMRTLLHRYDTTRPTTVAMHPRYRSLETDSLPAPLAIATDIASYNYRYQYFPGDRKRYPDHIFYQSEANTSMIGTNFFGMNHDWVVGLAYWGAIDYLGESMGWPVKGWNQGVFDISLQPKPLAYLVKSMFTTEPTVHIAILDHAQHSEEWNGINVAVDQLSDHWNRTAGETLSLYTYTNAEEVELLLNGKSLGRKRNTLLPTQRNRIFWRGIVYQRGRLEAVARNNGKIVARHRIETTGAATALQIEADNSQWKADGKDLQHLRITAIDRQGRRVWDVNDPLVFKVEGPAEIVATDNGDLQSDEVHVGNRRHLYHGSALVILRSTGDTGNVRLTVDSKGRYPQTIWKGSTSHSRR